MVAEAAPLEVGLTGVMMGIGVQNDGREEWTE